MDRLKENLNVKFQNISAFSHINPFSNIVCLYGDVVYAGLLDHIFTRDARRADHVKFSVWYLFTRDSLRAV